MRRKWRIILAVTLIAAVLFCGGLFSKSETQQKRVVIAGSTCMGKMLTALADAYAKSENGWVQAQLGGTELGLQALRQGVCDIASCSRALTAQESQGIVSTMVALDAIAVVVHPDNAMSDISLEQLRDIYSGKITSWEQLGGAKMPIVVIGREAGSGTRSAFEAAIGLSQPAAHSQEHSETGMLRTAVAAAPGTIGYLSFDYVNASVKPIAVNGFMPDEGAVRAGRYPISRAFWLCTLSGEHRDEVLSFLAYVTGESGQRVIQSLGILPAVIPKGVAP